MRLIEIALVIDFCECMKADCNTQILLAITLHVDSKMSFEWYHNLSETIHFR